MNKFKKIIFTHNIDSHLLSSLLLIFFTIDLQIKVRLFGEGKNSGLCNNNNFSRRLETL